jgi:Ca2+/Na+ antiporter
MVLFSWKPSTTPQNLAEIPTFKTSRLLLSLGALALCVVGTILAVYGGKNLQENNRGFSLIAMGPTLLGIVLCYPMIAPGLRLASQNKTATALDSHIGALFINLGLVLPILILLHKNRIHVTLPLWNNEFKIQFYRVAENLAFPRAAWRINSLALLILALPYIPASEKRLKLDMVFALILIIIQALCFYSSLALANI